MSAPTHPGIRTTTTGVDTRLPWWALVLPAAAFLALLVLMAGPGGAEATAGELAVGRVLEHLWQTLPL
ncbi:hypothetical protein [Streptomyces sp. NRRL B-24572]|uniref:hypothetical protein n=1 Tax=Streptomyces sp. NRRL B-24572 TaxID=1962156 RepID=UPI000A3D2B95|nr:hypothetical protein [Streptomyces sp. NRRL B-24572]